MTTYIIDTETTGREPVAEIIELAWQPDMDEYVIKAVKQAFAK